MLGCDPNRSWSPTLVHVSSIKFVEKINFVKVISTDPIPELGYIERLVEILHKSSRFLELLGHRMALHVALYVSANVCKYTPNPKVTKKEKSNSLINSVYSYSRIQSMIKHNLM